MDRVTLVNFHDRKIGEMDKVEAHRGKGKLHRAVSVFLFNAKGELLLQQRSEQKIVGARQWANTCCGNVRPSETRRQCAQRRLKEELGIEDVSLKPVYKYHYQVDCNEQYGECEIDQILVGRFSGDPISNTGEVTSWSWEAWSQLKDMVTHDRQEKFAPWFKIMMKNNEIIKAIEKERKRYVRN